jgi:hypothetical protein
MVIAHCHQRAENCSETGSKACINALTALQMITTRGNEELGLTVHAGGMGLAKQ